ncbi:hypothetical protein ACCY16_18400 [Candidatus Pantoea formicae]|uniref:hypothetical protein n=1 Tax=Candidatus Pantoea formicae TaxID=2608355 RepID=UPI003ED85DFC
MNYKLKTVDVWDTLLRRKCHPDTIKIATARYFFFKYYKYHQSSDLKRLFDKRVEIERAIGQQNVLNGFDDEYLIEDVILEWCKSYIFSLTDDEVKVIRDDLCDFEFNLECDMTKQDDQIVSLLNSNPSDKTMFLSDFYMSKKRLQALINKNGLGHVISDGFSSADIKLNKRSGHLFDHVKEKLNVEACNWLHIGDNEWSDVKQPEKHGIKSIHFMPQEAHQDRLAFESSFHDSSKFHNEVIKEIELLLSESDGEYNQADDNFKLGVKCSPFIVGFVLFIIEKSFENSCKKVYFFTREGEFFIKAFNIVIEKLKDELIDVEFPEYEILEVSRLATFSASIGEVNIQEMMRIWNLYSSQSMQAFAATLDIKDPSFDNMLRDFSIDPTEVIRYPWQDMRVQKLFSDHSFISFIENHRNNKKDMLRAYLSSKMLDDKAGNVCVVDVGWRGTIQDNISLILPSVNFHGVYLGLAKFLNPQPKNSKKYAYGPNLNISSELPHYLDSVAPIEMVTNSPSGSVIGYQKTSETVVAIRKVDSDENKAWQAFTKDFQKGILFSLDVWKEKVATHVITSANLRPISMSIWGGLITGVSGNLKEAFDNLNHNETFGMGGFVDKRKVPTLLDIIKSPFIWSKRKELISFIIANQWSDGIRKNKDISLINRYFLALIIDMAIFYKRNIMRR